MEKSVEKGMEPNQSLELIAAMIYQAKGNFKHNAIHFLLWGWVVLIGNAGMYFLIQQDVKAPYMIWLITLPAAALSAYFGYRQGKQSRVRTHLDTIYMWLWISYGMVIFTLLFFGHTINYQISPVILLFSSVPTFISGITLRFKPLVIGGILFWISSIICFSLSLEIQLLLSAFAIICGYLIPGYLLRAKKDN
jgi:hypothetical protein